MHEVPFCTEIQILTNIVLIGFARLGAIITQAQQATCGGK